MTYYHICRARTVDLEIEMHQQNEFQIAVSRQNGSNGCYGPYRSDSNEY